MDASSPTNRSSWLEACRAVGIQVETRLPDLNEEYDRIVSAYGGSDRAYHNLDHVADCLRLLNETSSLAERPEWIAVALWYHDVVYDSHRSDNEAESARWAKEFLVNNEVPSAATEGIERLILITRHDCEPIDTDSKLIVDIDLSILGRPAPEFRRYDASIRKEYSWVPADRFNVGRSQILRSFLDRPSIFNTDWFRDRYESQARHNLERAIQELAQPHVADGESD